MKDRKRKKMLLSKWVKTTKEEDPLGHWEDFIRHDAVEQYKEQLAIHNVSNGPDLTDLWFQTNGKKQQGIITEEDAKKIYDALNTLEKHDLCQLKFGI